MATVDDYQRLLSLRGYDGATPGQLLDAINEGRSRLVRDRRWSFLDSTSTVLVTTKNVATVSLAAITDLAHVDAVRPRDLQGNDAETHALPWQELREMQATDPTTGLPQYWSVRDGVLTLYPTPDANYTLVVEYGNTAVDLTSGIDPVFPDAFKDLIAWAATPTIAFRQRDAWAMSAAENQYAALFRTAASQDAIHQRQASQQVRSGYWDS